jgi:hypothetical protein
MSQSSLRGGFGPLSVMQRDPRLASRYRFADALSQQGSSTAPVSSPLEGLARALQGGLGGYFAGQAETEAQDRSSAASRLMGEALAKYGTDPEGALRMLGDNPDTADVASQIGLARALQKPADDTFTLAPGQRRVRADGTVIAEAPAQAPTPTGNVAAYQFAQQQGYGGSFMDFTRELAAAGRAPATLEPLVEVADPQSPTGRRMVPRSQAAGMAAPAPNAPQGTPQERAISVLSNPAIDPGSREYAQAYYMATMPQVTPNGVITPTLPDWVRPPTFSMGGAPAAQPAPMASPEQPPAAMPGPAMPPPQQASPQPPAVPPGATVLPPMDGQRTFRLPNGQEVAQTPNGLVDLRTGQPVMQFGPQTEAAGAPPLAPPAATAPPAQAAPPPAPNFSGGVRIDRTATAPKDLTETQSKDVGFLIRGRAALETLSPLESQLTSAYQTTAGNVPIVGNWLVSPEFQQAKQAAREFLAVVLRKDTGAAITNQEFDIYGPMYLPWPGDSPQVLEQKRDARARVMQGIEAGLPRSAIDRAPASPAPAPNRGEPPAPPPGFERVR